MNHISISRNAIFIFFSMIIGCSLLDPGGRENLNIHERTRKGDFNLIPVPDSLWFYQLDSPLDPDNEAVTDSNGIPIWHYEEDTYYHPVFIAQLILKNISSYKLSGNNVFLERARSYFDSYLQYAKITDHGIFFPYNFRFLLHGMSEEVMSPPWYSGMAQGQMLSVASRLYEITTDEEYLITGKRILSSFLNVENELIMESFSLMIIIYGLKNIRIREHLTIR